MLKRQAAIEYTLIDKLNVSPAMNLWSYIITSYDIVHNIMYIYTTDPHSVLSQAMT